MPYPRWSKSEFVTAVLGNLQIFAFDCSISFELWPQVKCIYESYHDGSVADETLEEETSLHDLSPCPESSQEEQPAQCDQDAWSVEDVQLEFLDISCVPEQRDENGPKSEVSSQTGCANCLPVNHGPVIDAEERALLNLLKFDNRVPRGSRWNASGVSRRYVTLVEWLKCGDEGKDRQIQEESADGEDK